MKYSVQILITTEAQKIEPRLAGSWSIPSMGDAPYYWQRGDVVQVQGIPASKPMLVMGRSWRAMEDETELTILLGFPEELHGARAPSA